MKELFLSDETGLKLSTPDVSRTVTNKKTLSYLATHKKDTWLNVMSEDEVLLRYKLIIKEKSQ